MRFGAAIFLFLIGLSVFAQVKFHGQVGMTISTFDRDLMEEYGFIEYRQARIDDGINASSEAKNSVRPGAVVSIEMDVYLNDNTFLKTGVKYTNGGDSYFFKTPDIQYQRYYGLITTDARFKYRPRLDYIAIPVNYGKKLGDFTIYGGLTTHINMATALRANYFEGSGGNTVRERWDREDDLVKATKTVFFFNIGANYLIPAFDMDNVVSLNIGYSLNPVYDQPNAEGQINSARLWTIEIGYGITLSTGD
ncbi:MAG: hypothetical protein RLN88_05485 [Ekhidna sp.]|uniref:hypothetical protein n=1 Tax=Ekhidna sp. TaxID=2608089 RepID=UPI0032F0029A